MNIRVTAVVCTLALLACGSTAWAARCSGIGAVGSGQGIVFCDDFDLYCATPSNPDGSCHTNNDPRDNVAFLATWPQDGVCVPNLNVMRLVTDGSWKGYDPIWQGYAVVHDQNSNGGLFDLPRHVHDMTNDIHALDVSKDSVNGSGNVISSRGDDGAGYVDPFGSGNPLPDTLKGQFFMNCPNTNAYVNFASYLELYLDDDRAPVDFVMAQDVGIQQCIDEGIDFPILDKTDGTIHRSFAFGMMAFYDTNPCDVNYGRRPSIYRAVVYDGLEWVQLRAPAFDLPIPDVEDLRLDKNWNQFYFAIGTDNIEIRLYNDKATAAFGQGVIANPYVVARIPRQYKGPFNKVAMGMAKGEDLTDPAGDVCYPALSGNNVKWDEVALWDGVLEVKIGEGACCLDNLTCTPNVSQDECENTLGGVYQGDGTSCVAVTQWRSVRDHNGTDFNIVLDSTASGDGAGGPTVESRNGGIQKIEVDFNRAVVLSAPGAISVTSDAGANSYVPTTAVMIDADTLQMTFASGLLPDEKCYNIDLAGAIDGLSCDTDCNIRSLVGDANGGGTVTLGDVYFVKSKGGQAVTDATCRFDVSVFGTINIIDVFLTKSKNRNAVTCP